MALAEVAELVYAHDSKSCGLVPCGFKSHLRYQKNNYFFNSCFIGYEDLKGRGAAGKQPRGRRIFQQKNTGDQVPPSVPKNHTKLLG